MFPIRSGIGNSNVSSPLEIHYKSLMAAAMHEIGQQAVIDTSILFFHQQAADVYYRESQGIPIKTDSEGKYVLYEKAEHNEIKKSLINVVMKHHIFDEQGLASRLSPLLEHMKNKTPIPDSALKDPFIQDVLATQKQYYANAVYNDNLTGLLTQICDFDLIENLDDEKYELFIKASYDDNDDQVSVAVFEDGIVQCGCDYCDRFFSILGEKCSHKNLNSIQKIMADSYNF